MTRKKKVKSVLELAKEKDRLVDQYDNAIMNLADDWGLDAEKRIVTKMKQLRKICKEIEEAGEYGQV